MTRRPVLKALTTGKRTRHTREGTALPDCRNHAVQRVATCNDFRKHTTRAMCGVHCGEGASELLFQSTVKREVVDVQPSEPTPNHVQKSKQSGAISSDRLHTLIQFEHNNTISLQEGSWREVRWATFHRGSMRKSGATHSAGIFKRPVSGARAPSGQARREKEWSWPRGGDCCGTLSQCCTVSIRVPFLVSAWKKLTYTRSLPEDMDSHKRGSLRGNS